MQDQSEADYCKANFRLEKHHVGRLVDAFQIPAIFKCDQSTICEGLEGLCIFLKRFAFPCRFSDMIPIFGRPVPELCMINNTVIDWVYNHHRHENSNSIGKNRNKNRNIFCSILRILLIQSDKNLLCPQQKEKNTMLQC